MKGVVKNNHLNRCCLGKREQQYINDSHMVSLAYIAAEMTGQYPLELHSYWMILHIRIYVQCSLSEPMQEVVCPFCSEVESKSLKVGLFDGCDVAKLLIFLSPYLQKQKKICSVKAFFLLFGHISVNETCPHMEQITYT